MYPTLHCHSWPLTAELAKARGLESTTPLWMKNRFWVMPPIQYVTSDDMQIFKHSSLKPNTAHSTSSYCWSKLYKCTENYPWCICTVRFPLVKRSETFLDPLEVFHLFTRKFKTSLRVKKDHMDSCGIVGNEVTWIFLPTMKNSGHQAGGLVESTVD